MTTDETDRPDDDADADETDRPEPTAEAVVQTASDAAEGVVFSRYRTSEVRDLDVTVRFEDGVLEVDVYLDAPADGGTDPERVADDAALAARGAVDDLFASADEGEREG